MRRLIVVLALVAGCGGGPEAPPTSVTAALSQVDRHVAAKDFAAARTALEELVRRTTAAREAGTIDEQRADRVIAAAARLGAALPRPVVTPSPTPAPEPTRDDKDDDKGDDDKGDGGKGKKGKGDD